MLFWLQRVAEDSSAETESVTEASLGRLFAYRSRTLAGTTAELASPTGADAESVSEISRSVADTVRMPAAAPSLLRARKSTPCRTGVVERGETARATRPMRSERMSAVVVIFMAGLLWRWGGLGWVVLAAGSPLAPAHPGGPERVPSRPGRPPTYEGVIEQAPGGGTGHGAEDRSVGLWFDPAVADDPVYGRLWRSKGSVEVRITRGAIVLRPKG